MLIQLVMLYVSSFFISLVVTPLVRRIIIRLKIIDNPNERKIHQNAIPSAGGLSIFISLTIVYLIFVNLGRFNLVFWVGGFVLVLLGVADDKLDLNPKLKFIIEFILAATIIMITDSVIREQFLFVSFIKDYGFIFFIFTIFWFIGIINSVNLIDGFDGLASGIVAQTLLAFAFIAYMQGNIFILNSSLVLIAILLAFLIFNLHPAVLFLGDTGSLFLGYFIAVLSLYGYFNNLYTTILFPTALLLLPLTDTALAITRRLIHKKNIFQADRKHIHHQIFDLGHGHPKTVYILYGVNLIIVLGTLSFYYYSVLVGIILYLIYIGFLVYLIEKTDVIHEKCKPISYVMMKLKSRGWKV